MAILFFLLSSFNSLDLKVEESYGALVKFHNYKATFTPCEVHRFCADFESCERLYLS